jgi:hypothetical protein
MANRLLTMLTVACLLVVATVTVANAQGRLETLNIDMSMKMDAIGNGVMTMKYTLNAAQYQGWLNKYGGNQALLRRDMSKFVSQYETRDWTVEEKPMDRTITISLTVLGCVLHKQGGAFEFRVPKQWRGGERTGTTFSYNYVEAAGGGAVSQTNVKLILPETASNFLEDKSETGDRVIQYSAPVPGSGRRMALWFGIVALIAGAGGIAASFRSPQPKRA